MDSSPRPLIWIRSYVTTLTKLPTTTQKQGNEGKDILGFEKLLDQFMKSQIWVKDGNTFLGEIFVGLEPKLPKIRDSCIKLKFKFILIYLCRIYESSMVGHVRKSSFQCFTTVCLLEFSTKSYGYFNGSYSWDESRQVNKLPLLIRCLVHVLGNYVIHGEDKAARVQVGTLGQLLTIRPNNCKLKLHYT